jgi:hypothetical protein
MKHMLSLAALLLLAANVRGQQTLKEFKWRDLAEQGRLRGAVPVSVDGREALKIENTNDTPLQVTLLTITNPPITAVLYGLVGEIRYDSVQGDSYLEMWNYFPSKKRGGPEEGYFSKTLDESGEMGKISGTSDWRKFELPFDRTGAPKPPSRLQVNLILKGRGTVYIGPVKLVQFPGAKPMRSESQDSWWSDQTAGWVGGGGGVIIGSLSGLCGWLAIRGKARGFVTTTFSAFTVLGAASGVAAIVAVAMQQPYGVWFPLVLGAVILLPVCPAALREYQRKYEELELRRMESMDASTA